VSTTLAAGYDLIIFDLDGVVYLGTTPVPGAPEAIRALAAAGTAIAYVTNNASRAAADVVALLGSFGIRAGVEEVVTSAQAAARLLAAELPAGAPVLVVGAPALRDEVARAGLTPVAEAERGPLAVVQGYGPAVGWPHLAEACVAIRAGARWVATNTDTTLPSPRGPLPGNGSLVAALATALGRGPDAVVGKPEAALFQEAVTRRGARRALVVGDRLDTDVDAAVRAGLDSLLVLTGVSSPADLLHAPAVRRPTHVHADLRGLSQPDSSSRVPQWTDDGGAQAGGWRVGRDGARLALIGSGSAVDALRALAAAAWASSGWRVVEADGDAARAVLAELGLAHRPGAPLADPGEVRAACAT
jgi:HAD superfamily hydrolase (TIGR01450 family)